MNRLANNARGGWIASVFTGLRALLSPRPLWPEGAFLMWEPCTNNHAEVVPGYARYLLDLGFEVVVLVPERCLRQGLFARFPHPRLHCWGLPRFVIMRLLRRHGLRHAQGLFVTTAGKLVPKRGERYDLDRVIGAADHDKVILVEHDARHLVDAGLWTPDLVTLRRLDYRGADSVVVNPHHFGAVRPRTKEPGRTRFVLVGAARSTKRSNHLVIDAADALVRRGRRDFEITIIGHRRGTVIPKHLRPVFRTLGHVSFDRLYDEMERADFLLTAYDGANPAHEFYRTAGTSGNFQLVLGFRKPCVVQESFAPIHGLDAGNSILYGASADYASALERAMDLDPAAHVRMQAGLAARADAVHVQSLQNLRELLRSRGRARPPEPPPAPRPPHSG
ncbi:MAG: hypothetical protein JNG83_02965 [Opitutaceae bacterium]|nr:hypothetical protein [Opitutaceae bacterium]